MRRFTGVWLLSVLLKVTAAYMLIIGIVREFGAMPTLQDVLSVVFYSLYTSLPLWAIAELLRLVANTEAYARGTYSVFRKRAEKVRNTAPPSPYQPFEQAESSDNLKYSPPERYRRTLGTAPVRRVTVMKDRAPLQERPPRPAGSIEPFDSLDNH